MKQIRTFLCLLLAALVLPLSLAAFAQEDDSGVITDTVESEDIQMDYCRFGTGEKNLVILPGLSVTPVTPSAELIAQSFALFADAYTVWLFDVPADLPEDCTIEDIADATADAMRSLGIGQADVFGASMGGMIAQCIAEDTPELVDHLILGSTAAYCSDATREKITEWIALARTGDGEALSLSMAGDIYTPDIVEANLDVFRSQGQAYTEDDLQHFITLATAITRFDRRGRLADIVCPVLVLSCEADAVMPLEVQQQLAGALVAEQYCYGPEYSHAVYDEAADYHDRMLDFLTQAE